MQAGEDVLAGARDALGRQDWAAALDAGEAVSCDDRHLEAERLDLVAEAAWWLGRLEDCIAAREEAYRIFDELGEHRRAGQAAVWLWEHHALRARPAVAGGWLRRGRRALEGDEECVEFGNLRLREAEVAHGSGDLDGAAAIDDEVIALARRLRSADLEAEALQARGRVRIDQGRVDEGMGDLDEAMLFGVEGRLGPFSTGKVYCSLISACEEVGDFDRAAEWTDATLRWAEAHPFAIFPGICRVHRAVVLKRRGSLAEAEREAARACEELRLSHLGNSAAAWAEVGDIRRRLGQLDAAEDAYARAEEIWGRPCGTVALLRLAQGRVDDARSIISGCLGVTSKAIARIPLLPTMVHVAVAVGDLGAADDALVELEALAGSYDSPDHRATVLATRGRLQLARNDPAAVDTLREALGAWTELEIPYEQATVRTLLGQALREAGDEDGARAAFAEAAKLFDQIGATLDAQRTDSPPKVVRPAGLTAREVEILQLIAGGLTNNEIAAELYLSAKTVSRHLSNIFTKIGVTSRAGATAFAFEHRLVHAKR